MIDDLRKLIDQVSDPWDLATVLIFGTGGYLIDAGINVVGFLDPGYVGVAAASGALGLRKAAEAAWVTTRVRKEREKHAEIEKARALRFLDLLDTKGHLGPVQQLERDLELFDSGIIGVEDLKRSLDEAITEYRFPRKVSLGDDHESPVALARFSTLELDEEEARPPEHKTDRKDSTDQD